MKTITRNNPDGTKTTYQRRERSPQRRAKDEARVTVMDGPDEAMEIDNYANVLLDFRDWCIANGIKFRVGVTRAVTAFRNTVEMSKAYGMGVKKLVENLDAAYCPKTGNSKVECAHCRETEFDKKWPKDANGFRTSALLCGHANESGVNCDCPPDCYCKAPGNTCGRKK